MSARPPLLPPPAPTAKAPGGSAPKTSATVEPPKTGATAKDGASDRRPTRYAAYALVAFTVLTIIPLAAWFATADQPWGFSSFVAVLSALLGTGTAALFWRQPTRAHAIGGLAVMGLSLVRVGLPTTWTSTSVALITITALLAIPVVQAAIVLPRS